MMNTMKKSSPSNLIKIRIDDTDSILKLMKLTHEQNFAKYATYKLHRTKDEKNETIRPPNHNYLALHRIGVQLAHVAASVVLRHRFHVQIPRVLVGMRHGHPRIVRDNVLVYGLDRFCVRLHPADLRASGECVEK